MKMVRRPRVQLCPRTALRLPQKEYPLTWRKWRNTMIHQNLVRGLLLRYLLAKISGYSDVYRQSPKQVRCHGKENHQVRSVSVSQIPKFLGQEMVRRLSQYNILHLTLLHLKFSVNVYWSSTCLPPYSFHTLSPTSSSHRSLTKPWSCQS